MKGTAKRDKAPSTVKRMKALGPLRPAYSFGVARPWTRPGEYRQVLPIRRSWPAILVVAVLLAIFGAPLFAVEAMSGGPVEDLFDLAFRLFTLFWMLGWSVAVAALALLLLALLFAREVLVADGNGDRLLLRFEVLGFGVGASHPAERLGNLRLAPAEEEGGNKWRGPHLAVDYCGIPVRFGCHIGAQQGGRIIGRLQAVLARDISGVPAMPPPAIAGIAAGGATTRVLPAAAAPRQPSVPAGKPLRLSSPSTLVLIFANLVPLAGVLLLGWDMGELMLLFWLESAIIGFYNVLKLAVIGKWLALAAAPFFIGHYGAFMAGHLLFIFGFFIDRPDTGAALPLAAAGATFVALWPAILALFASHGFSFFHNFLGRGEYRGRTLGRQMHEPYKRIIVMHLTIIFGGFLAMALESPLPGLVLLVVLKVFSDVSAHLREHGSAGERAAAAQPLAGAN